MDINEYSPRSELLQVASWSWCQSKLVSMSKTPNASYGPFWESNRISHHRCNNKLHVSLSTNVRNRVYIPFPQDLPPVFYDRLQYSPYLQSQDTTSKEIKENIQAVKELYLSKKLIPELGWIMIFQNGKSISEWFDPKDGIPVQASGTIFSWKGVSYLCSEQSGCRPNRLSSRRKNRPGRFNIWSDKRIGPVLTPNTIGVFYIVKVAGKWRGYVCCDG